MTADRVGTGCDALDELLGGGLERGAVTQVYGPPAAGKTNLALSAAVGVAAAGEVAVVVDTEGLSPERFETLLAARTEDVDAASERVVVQAAHNFEEQAQAVRDVADFAEQASLVVLDSATGFYRLERTTEAGEDGEALRRVARQMTHLLSLARRYDLAVVVTNQVYADPESDRVRPLGGHTLEHWTATVLRLERFRGGNRRATLEKHRSQPAGETARFRIVDEGLLSVDER
ncbi:MAG: DNA repair and recombination protein RadB [Halobacteriaceae archaeon]